jgi:multidrug transporter EmrE-like cation transporter
MLPYLLVLLGMLLNVGAQLALKWAALALATPESASARPGLSFAAIAADPLRVLLNGWFIVGLVLYAVSVVNWLVVLDRVAFSVAYPLMSIGYILTLALGVMLFKEPLSLTRVLGVAVIMCGVILITRPVGSLHA